MLEAEQLELERPVALKLLRLHADSDPAIAGRFLEEARATAALSHPNIVRLLDFDVEGGLPWIVYELMPGGTLATSIRNRRQPWDLACRQVSQVLAALEEAHAHGILHRDVKAQNVLVADDGTLKLCDFGLAKFQDRKGAALTTPGDIMGSPGYMGPELLTGSPATAATDLYAAGVLLFEALTGHWPFEGGTLPKLLGQHAREPPPDPRKERPEIPEAVAKAVLRALEKDPADRWPSARAFREAIRIENKRSVKASRPSRAAPVAARYRGAWLALAVGAVLAAVLAAPSLHRTPPPIPAFVAAPRPTAVPPALHERARRTVGVAQELRVRRGTQPNLLKNGVDQASSIREFRETQQLIFEQVHPVIAELEDAIPDRANATATDLVALVQLRALEASALMHLGAASGALARLERGHAPGGLIGMTADPELCYPIETQQGLLAFADAAGAALSRASVAPAASRREIAETLLELRWIADRFRHAPFCGLTRGETVERAAARLKAASIPLEGERLRALGLDIWYASAEAGTAAARRRLPAITAALDALEALGPLDPDARHAMDKVRLRLRETIGDKQ